MENGGFLDSTDPLDEDTDTDTMPDGYKVANTYLSPSPGVR